VTLDASHFDAYYEAIWNRSPFTWQSRLIKQILADGRWPDVIDLPTGSGKTSALDLAVFALACEPSRFARRIVFVVDRRVVVDQVAEHASFLATHLRSSESPVVGLVRDRLIALGGDPLDLLAVAALRGGSPIGNDWARWPDQPCVLASTVDQFGSRLLFRGYGVRDTMWPIHAGLTGNDCLVLLDEVHLAAPFAQTLDGVARWNLPSRLPRRWQAVQMSATPVSSADAAKFALDPKLDLGDTSTDAFSRRVLARKAARLVPLSAKSGETNESLLAREIPRILADLPAPLVGIIVNRVSSARAIEAAIASTGTETVLVTGRMRPLDRQSVVERLTVAADPDRSSSKDRLVVVATQCIEVGADLSFDALITEVAPLDSLKQRFGRLDRRGAAADSGSCSQAVIVGPSTSLRNRPDPVYGDAMKLTWEALRSTFGENEFDVGPMSNDLAGLAGLNAPRRDAPSLLPSHINALVQTNPAPPVEPDITPFLHGFRDLDTDVSVVWRADLGDFTDTAATSAERVEEALDRVKPHPGEAMQLPIAAVRAWLRGGQPVPVADVPVECVEESDVAGVFAFRWRGIGDKSTGFVQARDLKPGDLLIVPSSRGGINKENWAPESVATVTDLGDIGRATRRLHPDVLGANVPRPGSDGDAPDEQPLAWARAHFDKELSGWVEHRYSAIDSSSSAACEFFVLAGPRSTEDPARMDGSDDTNSFTGREVTLASHLVGVGEMAALMAERCLLASEIVADLRLAGQLHDLGKADTRFQRWLHGSELSFARSSSPLAKSPRPMSAVERRRSRVWSQYPQGMRHELMSVAMIHGVLELEASAADWDLVLHLVATHHGYCRPLPPIALDLEPQHVSFDVERTQVSANSELKPPIAGADMADRFGRLVERYGWHGLAWLEAIFRLADHRRSELEEIGNV
jgi:CRISPR-associated endonuclease/helicase Cas3